MSILLLEENVIVHMSFGDDVEHFVWRYLRVFTHYKIINGYILISFEIMKYSLHQCKMFCIILKSV